MIVFLILLLLLPFGARAQTCNTSNIECNSKETTGIVIGPPPASEANNKEMTHITIIQDKEWNSKLTTSVVISPAIMGNTKQIVHVVVVPGTATASTMPISSPRTHP